MEKTFSYTDLVEKWIAPMSKPNISKKTRKLTYCLPIIGPVSEGVFNAGSLDVFGLAKPNTVLANSRFGHERILYQDEHLIVCTNQYFIRYLQTTLPEENLKEKEMSAIAWHSEMCVGGLVIRTESPTCHIVDNIYVDTAFRCHGIATSLIERAYRDFPDLCLDGRFSSAGIVFFGARQKKRR